MRPKVLIITEGGQKIGMGHVARVSCFAQWFSHHSWPCRMLIKGDRSVKGFISRKGIKAQIISRIDDIKAQADLVIIDSYNFPLAFYRQMSAQALLLSLDDLCRISYPEGFILNGNVFAKKLDYPTNSGRYYLLGPEYQLLSQEYRRSRPAHGIREKISRVLITLGGGQTVSGCEKILKIILETHKIKLQQIDIVGTGQKKIKVKVVNGTKVFLHPVMKSLKPLILSSDLAITAGGQTLYELAYCGVPAIGICLAENQLGSLVEWQKLGFIKYIGWLQDKTLGEKLVKAFFDLVPVTGRKSMAKIGRGLVDGQGVERILARVKDVLDNEKN
ncbi:MAG: hypothetical protein PHV60_00425 [bacterium]|nr:hypothetical protein [bacterium]